jgi:penicillin-binding protein 1C
VAVWVGNFSGRPMDGVSGVSGAGPLLHRAVLLTANRYPPGALPAPRDAGAVPARICRLSGLLATDRCPGMAEWFPPDQVPTRRCDWHEAAGLSLPAEYAGWAGRQGQGGPGEPWGGETASIAAALTDTRVRAPTEPFRIVAPQEGDRYEVPPGVEHRYATIALRAGGGLGRAVRWFVDDTALTGDRWALHAGAHIVRAEAGPGEQAEVRIEVE